MNAFNCFLEWSMFIIIAVLFSGPLALLAHESVRPPRTVSVAVFAVLSIAFVYWLSIDMVREQKVVQTAYIQFKQHYPEKEPTEADLIPYIPKKRQHVYVESNVGEIDLTYELTKIKK